MFNHHANLFGEKSTNVILENTAFCIGRFKQISVYLHSAVNQKNKKSFDSTERGFYCNFLNSHFLEN